MTSQSLFQSPSGGFDLLGLRRVAGGSVEIVYDNGVHRRQVWRVRGPVREPALRAALDRASHEPKVIPALMAELRRRSIMIEAVIH